MKITFENKKSEKEHLVIIYKKKISFNQLNLDKNQINLIQNSNLYL